MSTLRRIQLPNNITYDINDSRIHIYRTATGIAATTSPKTHARWDITDTYISSYEDGMVVCVKVPVDGSADGVGMQINSLGYKPVVYNVNTTVGNRYNTNSIIWAVYNSTQAANMYVNGSIITFTGCWQVMDYDISYSNTFIYDQTILSGSNGINEKTLIMPTVDGTWSSVTNSDGSASIKGFLLSGMLFAYKGTTVAANVIPDASNVYSYSSGLAKADYLKSYTSNFVAGKPIYLVGTIDNDGLFYLNTTNFITQTLPSTADGYLYLFVGDAADTTNFQLFEEHPVYYHNGNHICTYNSFSADRGLSIVNGKIGHSNSITAGSIEMGYNDLEKALIVPLVSYDAYGHINENTLNS